MVPVVLSILLVVLMSGAVLWVVADDRPQPMSDGPAPGTGAPVDVLVGVPAVQPAPAPARRPATSRRRPPMITLPAPLEPAPPPAPVWRRPEMVTARMAGAPMPRHRFRSGFLLVVLVVVVGLVVAVVLGAIVTALAFALRAAVTS